MTKGRAMPIDSPVSPFGGGQASPLPNLWGYQPLVPVGVAVVCGVVLDHLLMLSLVQWLGLGGVFLTAWCAVAWPGLQRNAARSGWREWVGSVCLLCAVASVGGAWRHLYWNVYPASDIGGWAERQARPVRLRGVLSEEPMVIPAREFDPLRTRPGSIRTVAQIEARSLELSDGWRSASGRAALNVNGGLADMHAGDAVEVFGDLGRPAPASNPGEFDYADRLRCRRTRAVVWCDDASTITKCNELPAERGVAAFVRRVAGSAERTLRERLPEDEAEIAVALLLGRYELLEETVSDRYLRTGTMHILAISGQHLAILAGFLWLMVRVLPVPTKWGAVGLALVVLVYAMLTGARPPVSRAAVLVIVFVGSIVLNTRPRHANSMLLALLIVLMLNPCDLFDRGLQLSFLAVTALLWWAKPVWASLKREPDPLDKLAASLRPRWHQWAAGVGKLFTASFFITGVVWLVNVPLLAARFNLVTPIVVPLTLLMVPFATVALITGLLLLVVSAWLPWLAALLGYPCAWAIAGMDWCVRLGALVPGGYWYVPGPPAWWVSGFYLGVLGVLLFRPSGRRGWQWASGFVVWITVGFGLAAAAPRPERLECQVLSVGHGSAAIVRLPTGRTVLFDAGNIIGPQVGSRIIAPALWAAGVTRIDAIFISHADVDHFNGLPRLVERFHVDRVIVPPHVAELGDESVALVADALQDRGVVVQVAWAGDRFDLGGGVVAHVLHPPAEFDGTHNEQSLVVAVEHAGKRVLFTGDVEGHGLQQLLDSEPLDVDVLITPHHGSRGANTPELIAWTRPEHVIVSQGSRRSLATLDLYRAMGIPVYTTLDHGAVTVRIDAHGMRVSTTR
jgi:competence protein ComEC